MKQSEETTAISKVNGGNDYIYNKVYIDAFNAVSQGSGRTYPDARAKMFHSLSEGVVWWNYTGHASPNGWTGEGLLTSPDVSNNLFYKRLPILYAATCEFTRFDALNLSGGEKMFLNGQGGAIALICPPRLVYITQNGDLHKRVANTLSLAMPRVCLTDWATFCAGVKTTTEKPLPQATRTTICAISSLATLPCAQLLLR